MIIVLAAACHKAPPRTAETAGTRTPQAILVERDIKETDARIRTLRGLAEAVLIDSEDARQTDLAIVISRPNRIRADAVDTLADVWAAAGTDGKRMWLWLPQKGKLYRGAATSKNLKRLAAFDWDIPELVSIIAGLIPDARRVELDEVEGGKKGHFAVRGRPIHIWTDPKTRRITKIVRFKPDGDGGRDIQYEVEFTDYRTVGDGEFPYSIGVTFPEKPCSFHLRYKQVEFNASVDASLFKPEEVWRSQTVKIDQ